MKRIKPFINAQFLSLLVLMPFSGFSQENKKHCFRKIQSIQESFIGADRISANFEVLLKSSDQNIQRKVEGHLWIRNNRFIRKTERSTTIKNNGYLLKVNHSAKTVILKNRADTGQTGIVTGFPFPKGKQFMNLAEHYIDSCTQKSTATKGFEFLQLYLDHPKMLKTEYKYPVNGKLPLTFFIKFKKALGSQQIVFNIQQMQQKRKHKGDKITLEKFVSLKNGKIRLNKDFSNYALKVR
jgi:hypothetical protein